MFREVQKSVIGPCHSRSNAVRAVTDATPRTAALDDTSYLFDDGGKSLEISQVIIIFYSFYSQFLLRAGTTSVSLHRTSPLERSAPLRSDMRLLL